MKQTVEATLTQSRRGRPHKFGRPGRLLALTLPDDVIEWLSTIDPDPARAIVELFNRHAQGHEDRPEPLHPGEAEVVEIGGCRGLIVVNQADVGQIPGVASIPSVGGRAFLALEPGQRIADLELAVVDTLDRGMEKDKSKPMALKRLRDSLRAWRTNPRLRFHERTIIVVERIRSRRERPIRTVRPLGGEIH